MKTQTSTKPTDETSFKGIRIPAKSLLHFVRSIPVIDNPHRSQESIGLVELTMNSGKVHGVYTLIGRNERGTEVYCTDKQAEHNGTNYGVGLRLVTSANSIKEITVAIDPGYARRYGN